VIIGNVVQNIGRRWSDISVCRGDEIFNMLLDDEDE